MGANDKHEATYHAGEFTPDIATIRTFYTSDTDGNPIPGRAAQFNRWLETVRAEAKAEALNEVAKLIESKAKILDPEDPIQQGARIGLITASTDLANRANQYKEAQGGR